MDERLGDETGGGRPEGLRERKKREMRTLISSTATEMFLDRGFDDVRVIEVAEQCGVSEKTVYNYFPTKESLVFDREEDIAAAIRAACGPGAPSRSPTQAALEVLALDYDDLQEHWLGSWSAGQPAGPLFQRFADLVESSPSLQAAQRDMMERIVQVAAEALADRAGVSPYDPEPQIAATAIVGLWRVHWQALRSYSTETRPFEEVWDDARAEVERAARLIDTGLWAFEVMVQGRGTREQLEAAADAARKAGKQIATALRQARALWLEVQAEHDRHRVEGGAGSNAETGGRPEGRGHHGAGRPSTPVGSSRSSEGQGAADWHRWQHQQKAQFQREVAEWKQAQRELKQEYIKAKREQAKVLRDTVLAQQRRRGGPGGQER